MPVRTHGVFHVHFYYTVSRGPLLVRSVRSRTFCQLPHKIALFTITRILPHKYIISAQKHTFIGHLHILHKILYQNQGRARESCSEVLSSDCFKIPKIVSKSPTLYYTITDCFKMPKIVSKCPVTRHA